MRIQPVTRPMARSVCLIVALLLFVGSVSAETYYVKPDGNDGASGTSWNEAWQSIARVNSGMSGGDTCFFGTGIWRGTTLIPRDGSPSNRTVYACSSFVDVNGDGQYHYAQIYGSRQLTGWTNVGGNVYSKSVSWFRTTSDNRDALFQNDSVLWRQATAAAVDAPGEWWADGSEVRVYLYNIGYGYDPDDSRHNVDAVNGTDDGSMGWAVNFNGADYVTLYGLRLKYGNSVVVFPVASSDNESDSVLIERCHVSHACTWAGYNPSLFKTSSEAADGQHDWFSAKACSLGYAWSWYGTYTEDAEHGAAMTLYSVSNSVIMDSCTVYGHFSKAAIWLKNDLAVPMTNNVIRHSQWSADTRPALWIARCIQGLDVYGNVFEGNSSTSGTVTACYGGEDGNGDYSITNNTFVNCTRAMYHTTCGKSGPLEDNNEFRYNLVYSTGSNYIGFIDDVFAIDSNLITTGGSLTLSYDGSSRTLDYWQNTLWYDRASAFNLDPGLNGSWERPDCDTTEMYKVYPDGWVATLYGAVQFSGPDTTGPVISNVRVTDTSGNSATIAWTTSEPATSLVEYGLTSSYGYNSAYSSTLTTSHSVTITGLDPDTEIHFRVRSSDGSENETVGGDYQFSTFDVIPPDPVDDLTALPGDSHGEMVLGWTATGDDGLVGFIDHYEILYSYHQISESDWSQSDSVANPPSPAAPGTPQTYTLTGLTPGQSYYVAVVAVDDSRHRVMSNVVDTFTAGILVPPARFTDLDTANASAILSCPTVESYYDELVYEFELDVDSLFRSARYAGVTPEDAQIGVTFDQLDPDSIYYWHCRVVSLAPADSSDWTSYSAFNLLTGLLTGGEDTEDVPPSVFAYPNPVSFAQGDVLTFRLPAYPVDLMIRNSGSADRVLLRSGVSGEWEWDGRNDSGHPVTPGIYSWFIVGRGNRFDGKIMVQP